MKREKQTFGALFAILVILLLILPLWVTFNDFLTKIVENVGLYKWIQGTIVPFEVRMVKFISSLFGVNLQAYANGMMIKGRFVELSWNCLGWQSLFIFLVTLVVGFRGGNYNLISKFEAVVFGLLGIFWINLLRLVVIVVLFSYLPPLFAIVYHDYMAAIVTILFLFGFWWFAYK